MKRIGGYGDATAWTQGLDLSAESEFPEIIDGEEAGNDVFAKEVRNGAREACAERGVGGSEDSGRTGPGNGTSGSGVGERRRGRRELVEAEVRQDRRKDSGVGEERVIVDIGRRRWRS